MAVAVVESAVVKTIKQVVVLVASQLVPNFAEYSHTELYPRKQ